MPDRVRVGCSAAGGAAWRVVVCCALWGVVAAWPAASAWGEPQGQSKETLTGELLGSGEVGRSALETLSAAQQKQLKAAAKHAQAGRPQAAVDEIAALLSELTRADAPEPARIYATMVLGEYQEQAGRSADAERSWDAALQRWRREGGVSPRGIARIFKEAPGSPQGRLLVRACAEVAQEGGVDLGESLHGVQGCVHGLVQRAPVGVPRDGLLARLHPLDRLLLARLANARLKRGDLRGAEAALREASWADVPLDSALRRVVGILGMASGLRASPREVRVQVDTAWGQLLTARGDHPGALVCFERALGVLGEQAAEASDPEERRRVETNAALTRSNVASVLWELGRYDEAERQAAQALSGLDRLLRPEHGLRARALLNLGECQRAQGKHAEARKNEEGALRLLDRKAPGSPAAVMVRLNLAESLMATGELDAAGLRLDEAEARIEAHLGALHPWRAHALEVRATWLHLRGDAAGALRTREQAEALRDRLMEVVLSSGTEEQKLLTLRELSESSARSLTLHLGLNPDSPDAARLGARVVLRRKGRVLEAWGARVRGLQERADGTQRADVEALLRAREALATWALSEPDADAAAWTATGRRLEQELAQREAQLSGGAAGEGLRPVEIEDIQRAVPPGATLVEIVRYPAWQPGGAGAAAWGPPRYGAYTFDGRDLGWADLGAADTVDAEVAAFREAILGCPGEGDPCPRSEAEVRRRAESLYGLLWAPLAPRLGERRHVLLAPDGALNLLPFDALRAPSGEWVIQGWQVTSLSSGRDLLAAPAPASPDAPVVLVGAPDFGAAPLTGAASLRSASEGGGGVTDLRQVQWSSLPGAARELDALAALWPEARVARGGGASEAFVKGLARPRVLHLATHGFFLSGAVEPDGLEGSRGFVRPPQASAAATAPAAAAAKGPGAAAPPPTDAAASAAAAPVQRRELNPLLRSGIALAGANGLVGGEGQDGVLTALEASSLDLRGTRLVVLSACETGLGEVESGEGVYGLRRALTLAGAEAQVMSLWPVDDAATEVLMRELYSALRRGAGRSAALRQARLRVMQDPTFGAHPWRWAAFIPSGDWRTLDGAEPAEPVTALNLQPAGPPRAEPGAGGCASCAVSGAAPPPRPGLPAALLLALLLVARWGRRPQ